VTLEQVRRRLAKQARLGRYEEDLTTAIFTVAYEMKRLENEVLEMEIWRFNQILEEVGKYYKRQEKAMRQSTATLPGKVKTFR